MLPVRAVIRTPSHLHVIVRPASLASSKVAAATMVVFAPTVVCVHDSVAVAVLNAPADDGPTESNATATRGSPPSGQPPTG
jgi:hypothetical protein